MLDQITHLFKAAILIIRNEILYLFNICTPLALYLIDIDYCETGKAVIRVPGYSTFHIP